MHKPDCTIKALMRVQMNCYLIDCIMGSDKP